MKRLQTEGKKNKETERKDVIHKINAINKTRE
jgi:hypothetical protein